MRVAGVPFEILDDLASPGVAAIAREVVALDERLAAAAAAASAAASASALSRSERARLKKAIIRRAAIREDVASLDLQPYVALIDERARILARLDEQLATESEAARARLWIHAKQRLPDFLAFESDSVYRELQRPRENAKAADVRYTERVLARYLQRVAAKNDTISRFGPTVWGRVEPGEGFQLELEPGIAARSVCIERWVIRAVVAAMNRDPDVRPELCPRPHPNRRVDDAGCDGKTPAHQLDVERLARLAADGSVLWEVELVAFDDDPLTTLIDDVTRWRDGAAKRTWAPQLEALAGATQRFARVEDPDARRALMDEVSTLVTKLGGAPPSGGVLYQATNPIVEECARAGRVVLGRDTLAPVLDDMAPWLDLFSDTYALVASRGYRRLVDLIATAGDGVSLASLIAHGEAQGVRLRADGLFGVAREAYADVKRDFAEALASRTDAPEWELTREDCHVLRRKYDLPPVGAYGWACPDMQIAAAAPEDVATGNCTWIVAELHGLMAPLQRAVYWSCPDPRALAEVYANAEPWVLTSRAAATIASVHGSTESMLDTIPNASYSAPERGRPHWRTVAPSETEVVVVPEIQDVRIRVRATGEDLGSLVRTQWMVYGAMHPFFPLERAPHSPRLRLGRTIVQRESWRVVRDELAAPVDGGVTTEVVVAIERLRSARGLPRWVYVRPAGELLDHSKVMSRARDVKPMYVDLESPIFVDVFCRYLAKYGALDVVEMLPRPDQLCWREADGRYSFEIRMTAAPRYGAAPRT